MMNVCFVMSEPGHADLDAEFLELSPRSKGMVGIKGHRLVGGFRASIYNALSASRACRHWSTACSEFEKIHKP